MVQSPWSPVLAGLELTFMGLTRSISGLFSTPGFILTCGKKRKEEKKRRREGGKKGIEKERKEARRNKEIWRQDKKEF